MYLFRLLLLALIAQHRRQVVKAHSPSELNASDEFEDTLIFSTLDRAVLLTTLPARQSGSASSANQSCR